MNLYDYKRNLPLECLNAFYHILVTEYGDMFDPYKGDCLVLSDEHSIILKSGGREELFFISRYLDAKDPGSVIRSDIESFRSRDGTS